MEIPNHLYELLPITVLIGTIFVMAPLGPKLGVHHHAHQRPGALAWRWARWWLLGLGFVCLPALLGDYVAPAAERLALQAQAKYLGRSKSTGSTGAWLKERSADGHMLAVNTRAIDANGRLGPVRIFEFDRTWPHAPAAPRRRDGQVQPEAGVLELNAVQYSQFSYDSAGEMAQAKREQLPSFSFYTSITGDMALAAAHKPDHMPMLELWRFAQHLKANDQSAQKYEMAFWRKVFYPLSCLVMVVLALPFAYLHFRSGGIAGYVFGGVMAGISFFLLNNVFGYAGSLQKLVAAVERCGTGADVFGAVPGGLWLVGT